MSTFLRKSSNDCKYTVHRLRRQGKKLQNINFFHILDSTRFTSDTDEGQKDKSLEDTKMNKIITVDKIHIINISWRTNARMFKPSL